MNESLLKVRGLTTTFPISGKRVPVVDGVDIDVSPGETLAIVGESGCGKSLTALSLMRLVPKPGEIESGSVQLGGRELLELSVPEMRRVRGHRMSMIFQEPMTSLNPVMTCGAQVVEVIRLHENVSRRVAKDRSIQLFASVGIPDAAERFSSYPHQLSGGLKQRVTIAMALVTRPKLLIADEPTTALDVTIQAQILQLMGDLRREFDTGVLLITHDLGVVNEVADRVAVMYAGRIIEQGTRMEVLAGARHPYTQGLLRSMPGRAVHGQRLHEIAGVVPPPASWPKGCRFCTRCPAVLERCSSEIPGRSDLSATHQVHCHVVAEEADR